MPSHTDTSAIQWDPRPQELAANPAATFALTRGDWEQLGARFADFDDDLGGPAHLATGQLTVPGLAEPRQVAIMDHDADATYVMLPPEHQGTDILGLLLGALAAAGVDVDRTLLERLPSAPPRNVEERLDAIESAIASLRDMVGAGADNARRAAS